MTTTVSKVDKGVLLSFPNPQYNDKIKMFLHLAGVTMDDEDTKPELPIHLILGASEYSRIKTQTKPKIGKAGEPIAELTTLGWTMMSAGKEVALTSAYLTRTSSADYEQLCSLDVLGLEDTADRNQQSVYEEFKEQLRQSAEGWYETGLLWKHGHEPLPNNKQGSLRRLGNLGNKLQREPNLLARYDDVIQDQLATRIVERVTSEPVGREFYITHHRDRITRVWRHQWCRNSCRSVCSSPATLRDKPRFTSSEVPSGKKGVNDTKIRTGVGAHGPKSRGKHERRPPRPAHKISLWMVG